MNARILWTVSCVYGATGEGVTFMMWIGYADGVDAAKAAFAHRYGDFFTNVCTAEPGIARNDVTQRLMPADTLDWLESHAGKANIDVYSHIHLNAS